ncbi:hypothetical protein [Pseudolactococcus paracarnosus]|uniref:Uncharacterized protein n=1 Tax=Pseudolactococcus paracarnosus TaxID=2749962 RepID=A0A7L4WEG3_9LACT|nr:hypothetical protein [Lactococcus paracarnosus]SPC37238.1 membrane hypothetical protein [Lactococcus piscium]MCJ1977752.1 hypothetical protein [Lactococcus paracarnosus]MCJ1983935.1 hypothetical protein [Lactococcus paracarnosus]MCJ1993268.1 hypothetical protein [Lactococcus paracarnosus]MCJ1998492.1 hypothetical protein [Lactococcus paracarnosus]
MKNKLILFFATFSMATTMILFMNMLSGVSLTNINVLEMMAVAAVSTLFCTLFLIYVQTDFKNYLAVGGVVLIVSLAGYIFDWQLSVTDILWSVGITLVLIFISYELDKQTAKEMNQLLKSLKADDDNKEA